jgi:hypothetical protein
MRDKRPNVAIAVLDKLSSLKELAIGKKKEELADWDMGGRQSIDRGTSWMR